MKITFQKRNLSLFLLLGIVSLSIFYGIQLTNQKSIEKEVSPEIITTTSPQSSEATPPTAYIKPGIYIDGPSYIQRRQYQTWSNNIYYKCVDYVGFSRSYKYFTTVQVYINNTLVTNSTYQNLGQNIYVDVSNYVYNLGIIPILIKAFHTGLNTWINKSVTLNITSAVSLTNYFIDFKVAQHYYDSYNPSNDPTIYWSFDAEDSMVDYWFYFDDTLTAQQTGVYNSFSISYNSYGLTQTIGVHTVKLIVRDYYGGVTNNSFIMEVIPNSVPYISLFTKSCNSIILGETQNFTIQVRANHPNGNQQLNRIEIYTDFHFAPIATMKTTYSQSDYYMTIQTMSLYAPEIQNNSNFQMRLYARIVDVYEQSNKINQYNTDSNSLQFNIQNYIRANRGITINETLTFARSIITKSIQTDNIGSTEFRLTFVVDRYAPTTVFIQIMSGKDYHNENHHSRSTDKWNIFAQMEYENTWLYGGVVFWINFANFSAVNPNMIVKVVYPQFLEPDYELGDARLKLLHWKPSCSSSNYNNNTYTGNYMEGEWVVIPESLVKNISLNTMELYINEPGCYAFGRDSLDYEANSNGMNIPGYQLEWLIAAMGIGFGIITFRKNVVRRNAEH